jgi:hypothetical protein
MTRDWAELACLPPLLDEALGRGGMGEERARPEPAPDVAARHTQLGPKQLAGLKQVSARFDKGGSRGRP